MCYTYCSGNLAKPTVINPITPSPLTRGCFLCRSYRWFGILRHASSGHVLPPRRRTRTVHTNHDGSRTITVRTGMHHGLVRVERVTVV